MANDSTMAPQESSRATLVAQIKAEQLPALFRDPKRLGEYGANADGTDALDHFSAMMERSSVSALARDISSIVSKLADADPRRIAQNPTWLERVGEHFREGKFCASGRGPGLRQGRGDAERQRTG